MLLAVLKTGRVLSDELLTSQNLEIGYGFGAEAALFSGRKFQFVRKIGYLFCNIVIEKSGLITLRPANRAVIYEAKGKFAVSSFIQFDHDTVQLRSAKRYLALLPALHDAEVSAHVDEPDFLCPYYFCGFVVLDARSGNRARANVVIDDQSSLFKVIKIDRGYQFEWDWKSISDIAHSALPNAAQGCVL